MAVSASDIKIYLTGASSDGGTQTDPSASLGNYRSSTEYTSGTLFDDVSASEASAGDTEYRCVCVKNNHATDSLQNVKVWIQSDTGNSSDDVSFAIEVPTGDDSNGYAQTVADESTSPTVGSGNVSSWSDATAEASALGINQGSHDANLDAGEIFFIWIKRNISAGASSGTDSFTIRVKGETV